MPLTLMKCNNTAAEVNTWIHIKSIYKCKVLVQLYGTVRKN